MKYLSALIILVLCLFQVNAQVDYIEHVFEDSNFPFHNEVKLADMDNDGRQDIVALSNHERELTIAYNRNNNQSIETHTMDTEFSCFDMRVFDFDKDGDMDIIVNVPFESKAYWWRNDGLNSFERFEFPHPDYNDMMLADMNQDALFELVISTENAISIYSYDNADISLLYSIDVQAGLGFNANGMVALDANADGLADLIAADAIEGVFLFVQNANEDFDQIALLEENYNVDKIEVGDFNQDGLYDLLTTSVFYVNAILYTNTGNNNFIESKIQANVSYVEFAFLVDYDEDGDQDVVYYDTGFGEDGILSLYKNNNGNFQTEVITDEYERISAGTSGDLEFDQDVDLAFVNNAFFDESLILFENGGLTNITQLEDLEAEIYPSIAKHSFQLNSEHKVDLQIINNIGEIVYEGQSLNQELIHCGDWASGLYYAKLSRANLQSTIPLIKHN